jgi:hypothetical protein
MRKHLIVSALFSLVMVHGSGSWRDFPASQLLAQTSRTSRTLLVDLPASTATVLTDIGTQSSTLRGQLTFSQTVGSTGKISLTLRSFNFVGSSVKTRLGQTGPLGVKLRSGSAVTREFDNNTGRIKIDCELVLHYRLIDQIKGRVPVSSDDVAPYTEILKGQYTGTFSPGMMPSQTTTQVAGQAQFQLSTSVLGGVQTVSVMFGTAVGRLLPTVGCPGLQRLSIQPVFVRSGADDAAPTGRALDDFMQQVRAIWNKICVVFEVRDPMFVDNESYKVLTLSEEDDLMRSVNIDDAVEIFFIESFDPADKHGGGVTYSGGSVEAKIIVADNNIEQNPASINNLAHELGHALSLCHPGDADCLARAGRNPGSTGTVICPSGFDLDNPDLQSQENADNVSIPLLRYLYLYCCQQPDCLDDCGECPVLD